MFKYKAQLSPNRYHHHPPIQLGGTPNVQPAVSAASTGSSRFKSSCHVDKRQQTPRSSYVYNYAPEKNNMERTINDGLGRCFSSSKCALAGGFGGSII